jgi:hypothetical protein
MTFPEFSTRSCCFFASAKTQAARNKKPTRPMQTLFFIGQLLIFYGGFTSRPLAGIAKRREEMRAGNGELIIKQNAELVPASRVTGHLVSGHFHLSDFGCVCQANRPS